MFDSLMRGLFVAAIAWGLAACAKPSQPANNPGGGRNPIFGPTLDPSFAKKNALRKEAEKAGFGSEGELHEAVGFILSDKDEQTMGVCTGFLIDEQDLLATNSHCIPDAVKKDPSLCKSAFAILFKTKSGEREVVGCEKLISFTEITDDKTSAEFLTNTDFALMRLDKKMDARPLKSDISGFQDMKSVSVYAVDPWRRATPQSPLGGTQRDRTCVLVQKSTVLPAFIDSKSPVGTAFGNECDLVPGNSGSPVIDPETGNVLGLIQGGEENLPWSLKLRGFAPAERAHMKAYFFTNLSGLNFEGKETKMYPEHRKHSESEIVAAYDEAGERVVRSATAGLKSRVQAWRHGMEIGVEFAFNLVGHYGGTFWVDADLRCLAQRDKWNDKNPSLVKKSLSPGEEEEKVIPLKAFDLILVNELDQFHRPTEILVEKTGGFLHSFFFKWSDAKRTDSVDTLRVDLVVQETQDRVQTTRCLGEAQADKWSAAVSKRLSFSIAE